MFDCPFNMLLQMHFSDPGKEPWGIRVNSAALPWHDVQPTIPSSAERMMPMQLHLAYLPRCATTSREIRLKSTSSAAASRIAASKSLSARFAAVRVWICNRDGTFSVEGLLARLRCLE